MPDRLGRSAATRTLPSRHDRQRRIAFVLNSICTVAFREAIASGIELAVPLSEPRIAAPESLGVVAGPDPDIETSDKIREPGDGARTFPATEPRLILASGQCKPVVRKKS